MKEFNKLYNLVEDIFEPASKEERDDRLLKFYADPDSWTRHGKDPRLIQWSRNLSKYFEDFNDVYSFEIKYEQETPPFLKNLKRNLTLDRSDRTNLGKDYFEHVTPYFGTIGDYRIVFMDFRSFGWVISTKIFSEEFINQLSGITENIFQPASDEEADARKLDFYRNNFEDYKNELIHVFEMGIDIDEINGWDYRYDGKNNAITFGKGPYVITPMPHPEGFITFTVRKGDDVVQEKLVPFAMQFEFPYDAFEYVEIVTKELNNIQDGRLSESVFEPAKPEEIIQRNLELYKMDKESFNRDRELYKQNADSFWTKDFNQETDSYVSYVFKFFGENGSELEVYYYTTSKLPLLARKLFPLLKFDKDNFSTGLIVRSGELDGYRILIKKLGRNHPYYIIYVDKPFSPEFVEKYLTLTEDVFKPASDKELMDRRVQRYAKEPLEYWSRYPVQAYLGYVGEFFKEYPEITEIYEDYGFSETFPNFDVSSKLTEVINTMNVPDNFNKKIGYGGELDGYVILSTYINGHYMYHTNKPFTLEFIKKYSDDNVNEDIFEPTSPEEQQNRKIQFYQDNIKEYWWSDLPYQIEDCSTLGAPIRKIFKDKELVYSIELSQLTHIFPKFTLPELTNKIKIASSYADGVTYVYYGEVDGYTILYDAPVGVFSDKPFDVNFIEKHSKANVTENVFKPADKSEVLSRQREYVLDNIVWESLTVNKELEQPYIPDSCRISTYFTDGITVYQTDDLPREILDRLSPYLKKQVDSNEYGQYSYFEVEDYKIFIKSGYYRLHATVNKLFTEEFFDKYIFQMVQENVFKPASDEELERRGGEMVRDRSRKTQTK